MLSESFINFLSEALTISKEPLQLREGVAQEAGPAAGRSASEGCVHCPYARTGPRSWGSPARPQSSGLVRLRWGCSTKDGWSETPTEAGSFGGTKRVAEGAAAPMAGRLPTPVHAGATPSSGGHGEEGQSP